MCARLEESLPDGKTTWHYSIHEPEVPEGCADAPEWIAVQIAVRDGNEAGLLAVLTTTPATLAGVAAVLEHVGLRVFPDEKGGINDPIILADAFGTLSDEICDAADAQVAAAAIMRSVVAMFRRKAKASPIDRDGAAVSGISPMNLENLHDHHVTTINAHPHRGRYCSRGLACGSLRQ